MSVYRSIVISLINSAEYKVIPDAEKAARYNTNSPEYYVLMDSEGNKVENISEIERYLVKLPLPQGQGLAAS